MARTDNLLVSSLHLDLENFRVGKEPDEASSVRALVEMDPKRFWAVVLSLITDGILPTENIIVLESGKARRKYVVKEGNRRVAALKMIHGIIKVPELDVPSDVEDAISGITPEWKKLNARVPCAIYSHSEEDAVYRVVELVHVKGEDASRLKWESVAGARYSRTRRGAKEVGLDVLDKYLESGRNLTAVQKVRWRGMYPLTVLNEALSRLAPRLETKNAAALAADYVATRKHSGVIDRVAHDIGLGILRFSDLRAKHSDFGLKYGLPPIAKGGAEGEESTDGAGKRGDGKGSEKTKGEETEKTGTARGRRESTKNQAAVRSLLNSLRPKGAERGKVRELIKEALKLRLRDTPLAFCFVVRALFEVSAKAYCAEHGIQFEKSPDRDKRMRDVFVSIVEHMALQDSYREVIKEIEDARSELAKQNGMLSFTALNRLVHSRSFSTDERHIATDFGNIFPLLKAMNP